MHILTPKSAIEGNLWPGVAAGRGAALLAMQFQLEQSQWWPPEIIKRQQYRQLAQVLRHAGATVPYYQRRFSEAGIDPARPLDDEAWARIPLLTRKDVQEAGESLSSRAVPAAHGKVHALSTSGSTGMPVTTKGTQLTQFFWLSFTLRDQVWHGFDVTRKLGAIRFSRRGTGAYPDGTRMTGWGPATDPAFATGQAAFLNITTPVEQQLEWLQRESPDYLITYPSNLMSLVTYCRGRGIKIPSVRFVETLAEILHPDVRSACREVWGVKVVDMYSSQEVGYIALQCPKHEHYHVQAENVLVEIIDDQGKPCRPGATGRVVVTPLHNFAAPLIRYSIGDYAVVGEPCPCGRGLPVLNRILGRVRNMLTLPSGAQMWPYFGGNKFAEVAPVSQYQIVQKSLGALEVRIVPARPLTEEDEARIRDVIEGEVGKDFTIAFSYHEEIGRSKGGKFEDFRSEIAS
ncbi:MAG: AMP-binding protein [Alphaproteobacteria bacterium]